jgi:hypothetical protein
MDPALCDAVLIAEGRGRGAEGDSVIRDPQSAIPNSQFMLEYAIAAKDWDRAAGLIEMVALNMLVRWQQGLLQSWIKLLPDQALAKGRELKLLSG